MAGLKSRLAFTVLLFLIAMPCGTDGRRRKTWLPFWKMLFWCLDDWSGHLLHSNETEIPCKLELKELTYANEGGVKVFFDCPGIHIKMKGFSDDNETVIFEEEFSPNNRNKTEHFEGQTNIAIVGSIVDYLDGATKFKARVSSDESDNLGAIIMCIGDPAPEVCKSMALKMESSRAMRKCSRQAVTDMRFGNATGPMDNATGPMDKGSTCIDLKLVLFIGVPCAAVAALFLITAIVFVGLIRKGYLNVSLGNGPRSNFHDNLKFGLVTEGVKLQPGKEKQDQKGSFPA